MAASTSTTKDLKTKDFYSPEEVDQVVGPSMFHKVVRCSECDFGSRVKQNLLKHLRLHLRRRQQTFAQKCDTVSPYRDLAGPRFAQLAGGSDYVTGLKQLGQFPLLTEQFLAQTRLNGPTAVAQGDENQLADVS